MLISVKGSLQGNIAAKQKLNGSVSCAAKLSGSVNVGGVIKEEPDYYEGPYEVIPKTVTQDLQTEQKFLTENVKVKEIPYAEVTNTANGLTITIGGE